ncbi:hypothetical protein [uncultured Nitratireductor sp.]|uniref:hypothetical protein n=1 Tax=uncultured Nitratireductor sp. TaxID=520953 RepID=UPI00260B383F|nr:hypothetical protein [uncultured Nitratireductor sp.]
MSSSIWTYVFSVFYSFATMFLVLTVPAIRAAVGKYVTGLVQHHFDERIETLKSELRRSEEQFSADLKEKDRQLKTLTETTLALRSARQTALDARRLQAVEKIWAAKIAIDRMKLAAGLVSGLNLEELFKAADKDDPRIQAVGAMLDKMSGVDLDKAASEASALSEQPFLSPKVWALFSAYQGVMTHSVIILKSLALGAMKVLKREDLLKPLMLVALPEYKDYIERFGFSGYYHLLEILEQKLLNAMAEELDGKALDDATLKRSAEIMSAVQELNAGAAPEIPEELQGQQAPAPTKTV